MTDTTVLPARPPRTSRARNLTKLEADAITMQIKSTANELWLLIAEAHERKAHKALGYPTWDEYAREQLHMSPARTYQLLDTGLVIRALQQVAGIDTATLSELPTARETMKAKQQLPALRRLLKEQLALDGSNPGATLRQTIHLLPDPPRSTVPSPRPEPVEPEPANDADADELEDDDADDALEGEVLDADPLPPEEVALPDGAVLCPTCGGAGYVTPAPAQRRRR